MAADNTAAAPAVADLDAARKSWATVQARGALAGITLVRLAGGGYAAQLFGRVINLPDLASVEAMLQRAGAPA